MGWDGMRLMGWDGNFGWFVACNLIQLRWCVGRIIGWAAGGRDYRGMSIDDGWGRMKRYLFLIQILYST
jgi:hypothetical protein